MAVDFAKVKIPLVTLCVAFLAFAPRAGAQCDAQRITLKPGWNAVYVEVSPEGSAADISDWSGALFVSPMTGLDFGTDAMRATLSIRNDGDEPRTVSLELRRAVAELDARVPFLSTYLRWRDEDVARTNSTWHAVSSFGEVARKRLDENDTWRVAFGLNRAALPASFPRGEAAWNPEGTKTGTCHWTFSNLMRQGDITLSGPMTVKRVSPLAELVLE